MENLLGEQAMSNDAVFQTLKGSYNNTRVTVNLLAKEGAQLRFETLTQSAPDETILSRKDVAVVTYLSPF
jgi:hypothetical protein